MKILVPVKRVLDYNVKPRIKADGSDVDLEHAVMVMNPFDEIALEEAIRLKEAGDAQEVVALSIGALCCEDVLRSALAMGADRAALVVSDQPLEPLNVAKLLAHMVGVLSPNLVLMGKQAIDDDASQVGPLLAAMLRWPQACFASAVDVVGKELHVVREVDRGLETVSLSLPAVITVDLRLNEPRYPALPDVMKARSKALDHIKLSDLGLDLIQHTTLEAVEEVKPHRHTILFDDPHELIAELKQWLGS